jgi:hypothetical protein
MLWRWREAAVTLTILLSIAALDPCLAQESEEDSWENLKNLRVGQEIQVIQATLKSLKGSYLGFSDEAISLRLGDQDTTVSRPDVMRGEFLR